MTTTEKFLKMTHTQRVVYMDMRRGNFLLERIVNWGSNDNKYFHWKQSHDQKMRELKLK